MWYYSFMPYKKPKPGSLCDPYLVAVGEKIATNYSIFDWNVQTIDNATAGGYGAAYKNHNLTFCDVNSIYLGVDGIKSETDVTVSVTCSNQMELAATLTSSFTLTYLPGTLTDILGTVKAYNEQSQVPNFKDTPGTLLGASSVLFLLLF